MKNKINYLFLLSTIINWIFILILFLLNVIKLNQLVPINKINEQNKVLVIVFIIIDIIVNCLLLALYYWMHYHKIKHNQYCFAKKLINNIYLCSLIVAINLIISCLLISFATYATLKSSMLAINISALVIASVMMIVVCFYSYYLDVCYQYSINNQNKSARKGNEDAN